MSHTYAWVRLIYTTPTGRIHDFQLCSGSAFEMDDSRNWAHFRFLNLAPFGVEHSIEKRITPVTPDRSILHENALSPHSDLFQNPCRRDIFGIAPREESMQAKLVKAERKKRLCDFDAISLAPEPSIEPEANIGLA